MNMEQYSLPAMGWNSWNTFGHAIHENLIYQIADAMVSEGLRDLGYKYVIIDDCWSKKERDEQGFLQADPQKFPSGMKAVADYIHERGLKFGMYSCCGDKTCAGYPGSFEHEFQDAETFAQWGVDYLKYDNCYKPANQTSASLMRRMAMALRQTGRDIHYAVCQWGTEDVETWARSAGAHSYRSTIDIQDSWRSVRNIAMSQFSKQGYNASFCHNDMDMLVVGMYGKGSNPDVIRGGCSDAEYQTHFALWALMGSPLIIGCDVRQMNANTKNILGNEELIAMNQDPEGRSAFAIQTTYRDDQIVLAKLLSDGSFALGYFNLSDQPANITLNFRLLGLPEEVNEFYMRDCIGHRDIGKAKRSYTVKLFPHSCRVFRARIAL